MRSEFIRPGFLIVAGMILAAAFVRLVPHPPNFTPVAAMALFGGRYFSKRSIAFLIPLLAMILTDMIIGFHYLVPIVYFCFMLIVGVGIILRKKNKLSWLVGGAITASTLFFIITNFAEWVFGIIYAKTFSGLITCFIVAVPFYATSMLGDLFFVGLMFYSFELIQVKYHLLAKI